jgi:hypothetical protein
VSDSSDPPSTPLLLDLFIDIDFIPAIGLFAGPLPESRTYVVSKDTSSVVIVSSQIIGYVACQ